MQYTYQPVDRAWKKKFLTTQADNLCLAVRPATGFLNQFVISSFDIQNRSGGSVSCAAAGRLPVNLWKAGRMTGANVFTDDTANAQADVADGFNLGVNADANSGIIVMCRIPFNVISVVTTTVATAGATFDLAYSITGAAWQAITGSFVAPDWTPAVGEQLVHFPMPGTDWTVMAAGHSTGIPVDAPGWYGIRIRETSGPAASGKARNVVIGVSRYSLASLGDGNVESVMRGLGEVEFPAQCDGLAAIISSAADGNMARCNYRLKG
jgi:hypothetical protein